MIQIEIPGRERLQIDHLLLDFNGTLAKDGALLPGIAETLTRLSALVSVHVITADTFGTAAETLRALPVSIIRLDSPDERNEKLEKAYALGSKSTIAIGNGKNDALMLREAVIGICVIGPEGCASETLTSADIVVGSIDSGLDLLLHPDRLRATLRY